MNNNKLVSVIIPVYNVAPFVVEALDSVLNQTFRNLEIIIIDDGSTDGSGLICDEYAKKDSRVRLVHQKNAGLSAARNVGLNMMSGDVVAFLDPDDAYRPDYVQIMIDVLLLEKVDAVVCKYTNHITKEIMHQTGGDKVVTKIKEGVYDRSAALRALAEDTLDHIVWNKIFLSSTWADIRFPDGYVYEDVDTTYRVINQCNKICVLDEPLYMKRTRPGSITKVWSKKNITDWFMVHHHFEIFVTDNIPDVFTPKHRKQLLQKRLRRMIVSYTHYILENGDSKAFSVKLRNYIVSAGPFIGTGRCRIRMKIGFWMICHCPGFFTVVSSVYYSMWQLRRSLLDDCSF